MKEAAQDGVSRMERRVEPRKREEGVEEEKKQNTNKLGKFLLGILKSPREEEGTDSQPGSWRTNAKQKGVYPHLTPSQ